MKQHINRLIILLTFYLTSTASFADAIDDGVNHIYTRMSAAYDSLNIEGMKTVMDKEGIYVQPGKSDALLKGHDMLMADYGRFFDMLKKHNASINIQFRVVDRKKTAKMVADMGYFMVTITPPEGSGREANTNVGKFITTSILQKDGAWAFYSDINMDADMEFYEKAKKLPGVKFD